MRKLLATLMIFFLFVSLSPMVVEAASPCPPEVQAAKNLLTKQVAKSQDVQAPRSLAASKSQEVQAPRGQEVQAPKGQEVQAPRSLTKVRRLVREAEAACRKGNMELASKKANEAMALLQ